MIAPASSYSFVFRWYCTTYLCWYESLHRPINLISREREVLPAFVIVWYWSTYLDTWYCSAYLDTLPEGCLVLWQSWPQEEFKSVAILTTGQWWWLHNRIHFSIYIIHKPGCAIDNRKCNLKLTDLFYIEKSCRYISTLHFLNPLLQSVWQIQIDFSFSALEAGGTVEWGRQKPNGWTTFSFSPCSTSPSTSAMSTSSFRYANPERKKSNFESKKEVTPKNSHRTYGREAVVWMRYVTGDLSFTSEN